MIGLKLAVALAQGRLLGVAAAQNLEQPIPAFELVESDIASAATFTTDAVDLGHGGILAATLTTANITGTLTTVCQTSADGSTWVPAFVADSQCATYATAITGTFGAITTNVATRRKFVVDRFVRFVHTIVTGPVDIAVDAFIRAV